MRGGVLLLSMRHDSPFDPSRLQTPRRTLEEKEEEKIIEAKEEEKFGESGEKEERNPSRFRRK